MTKSQFMTEEEPQDCWFVRSEIAGFGLPPAVMTPSITLMKCMKCGKRHPLGPCFTDWPPIETAPRDGTIIIGLGFPPNASVDQIRLGKDVRTIKTIQASSLWVARNDFGEFTVGFHPTHWMPMPELPS